MSNKITSKQPFHIVVNNMIKNTEELQHLVFRVTESIFASNRPIANIIIPYNVSMKELQAIDNMFNVTTIASDNNKLIVEIYGLKASKD